MIHPPGHPEHMHRLNRDGFYACGCPDPHVNLDPEYDSSLAFVADDDVEYVEVHDWFDPEGR